MAGDIFFVNKHHHEPPYGNVAIPPKPLGKQGRRLLTTFGVTLNGLRHCEPLSGGVAISRTARGEIPLHCKVSLTLGMTLRGSCHCERAKRAWQSPARPLRRLGGRFPGTVKCRFARHDINRFTSLRAAVRRRGNLPQDRCAGLTLLNRSWYASCIPPMYSTPI